MRRTSSFPNVTAQQQPRRSVNLQQQQASGGRDYQPRGLQAGARQMGQDDLQDQPSLGDAWDDVPAYKIQGE